MPISATDAARLDRFLAVAAGEGQALTAEQRTGVGAVGRSLLVSAAAGSGKTTVLAQRCAYLVCAAPEPHRCGVDELLVVTFTEKAAAEMRERIGKAIRAQAAAATGADAQRLDRQVQHIDQAAISTLHSFCARLLRQHFHLVGLDPSFSMMDAEEAGLLRREVGRALIEDCFDRDESADQLFHRLVDHYADGDDEKLLGQVLRTHDLLCSLVDPAEWLARSRQCIAEATEAPLESSHLGAELVDLVGRRIEATREQCAGAIALIRRLDHFPGYLQQLREIDEILRHALQVLADEGLDTLGQEMAALELPSLPRMKSDTPHKDVAKKAIDAVRNAAGKGNWRDLLRFTTEQWRDGMRLMAPYAHTFLSVVEEFGLRYRRAKDAARQLDFADLERFALQALRDPHRQSLHPSPTARMYHRLFKHVLVDEFQDINGVQAAILSLVSHECLMGRPGIAPNLFRVGDVKQSIYRFRLAEPEQFIAVDHAFRSTDAANHGRVIDLQANFRGRAPLLEAINGVFERLMTAAAAGIDYDERQRLLARKSFPPPGAARTFSGAPIELHLLPAAFGDGGDGDAEAEAEDEPRDAAAGADDFELDRAQREALLAARRIRALVGLDGGAPMQVLDRDNRTYRPIRFHDIVVLLRTMQYKADQYADILRQSGLPVHAESGTGYFESTEVRDMLALLSVLDNQLQDIPLAALLRSPLGLRRAAVGAGGADGGGDRIEEAMARITAAYRDPPRRTPFHLAVVRYAAEHQDDLAADLRRLLDQIEVWRVMIHRRPVAEAIWSIYEQTGYLAYVRGLFGGEQREANLLFLHQRAGQFDAFQHRGLGRFIDFLDQLRVETDLGQPSTSSEAEDVVRIMSIHRSKGLEFPVVVLPDLGKAINLKDTQGPILVDREMGLGMAVADEKRAARYPSLAGALVRDRLRRHAIAEELRVLYVAMTRAKECLIGIGTCKEDAPDQWQARWSDHRGPLPAETVLCAHTPLDWLGPVSACAAGAAGEIIRAIPYGSAEVAKWPTPARQRARQDARRERLAGLAPLDPPPPPHPRAEQAIERLTYVYPFAAAARRPAARAVTGATDPDAAPITGASADALAPPRFLAGSKSASSAEIGAATHLLLHRLDFSRPLDPADIDAQIESLVDKRILDPALAARVDRPAVVWLASSDIGRLLRDNAERLHREMPIHFTQPSDPASPGDPCDAVMIRGRIDALIPGLAGSTLIDYKTDAIPPAAVPARAEAYRPQLQQYRQAVEAITRQPVAQVVLVFLSPRVVWTMAP